MEWSDALCPGLWNGGNQESNLSSDIDIHHKRFLTSDGTPKEESLILLRVHAIDFLCEVPHSKKFKFRETEDLLAASVKNLPGFDPRKTSSAFEDLAKYAHNLLEQPWRKDFHRIKATSGFWIHNIRAHLHNAQEMLRLIGYVATDSETLVLARPPHTSMLSNFSRDCFIASQECLIASQVWEGLLKDVLDCPLTLQDVFETRKLIVGDMHTVISNLKQEVNRRQQEVEEALAHLRERGIAPQEFTKNASPSPPPQISAFVPIGKLIDISDTDTTECHDGSDSSSQGQPHSQKYAECVSMSTSTSNSIAASSSPSLITSHNTSSDLISELVQEQETLLASLKSQDQRRNDNAGESGRGENSITRGLGSNYFNFNTIGTGKSSPKSKIPNDFVFNERDTKGHGILDKVWQNVPSLSGSIKKLEQYLASDNKVTPSSTFYTNNNDDCSGPWDCPHCTFVNQGIGPICSMCSKSRDFALPS